MKNHPDFEIVAEASNGKEAIEFLIKNKGIIDVVLLDINMPEKSSAVVVQFITKYTEGVEILALTSHSE